MNKRGVYTPDQIQSTTEHYWTKYAPTESIVNKEIVQNIVKESVNELGSIGSGKQFDEQQFDSTYKTFDPFGLEKNTKLNAIAIVSNIIITGQNGDDEKKK